MPKPLQFGDPSEVGPFRLESRLHESPAGIVFLGRDRQGRPVEVALLTTAAAEDAAARDRFRTAVAAEFPRPGVRPRTPPPSSAGEAAPVVAALAEGGAPWVATAHEDGHAGAERFLKPVLPRGWGPRIQRGRGPQFQPYWLSGPRGPAWRVEEPPAMVPAGDTRGLVAAVVSLLALLSLLLFLLLLLFSCEPSDPRPPQPTELPTTAPATPRASPPATPRATPSRGVRRTEQPTRPTPTDGGDTVNPAARPGGGPGSARVAPRAAAPSI